MMLLLQNQLITDNPCVIIVKICQILLSGHHHIKLRREREWG